MELVEFSKGSVWGILPEKFEVLNRKFFEFELAETTERAADFYVQENRLSNNADLYRTEGEVAVIPISGPLMKRRSFFSFLFGGSTYLDISRAINAALNDDQIGAIMLAIDSPGGTISGVEAVSDLIFEARKQKPIIAYSDGLLASAAYWIGSAAEVIVADKTARIGSIGVLMIHTDYSKADEKRGIKETYITAGRYKAIGNNSEPLSSEAREYIQSELDYIYSIFVDTVARNRDVETEKVLSDMADGKIFIGSQAKDAGLIDRIGNYSEAAGIAASMISNDSYFIKGVKNMEIKTIENLIEKYPDLITQIQDATAKKTAAQVKAETEAAERENFVALLRIQLGDEVAEKFKALLDSGTSPAQLKAIKALNPDPEPKKDPEPDPDPERSKMLSAIQDAAPDNPGPDQNVAAGKDYMELVREYKNEKKCDMFTAMKAIDSQNPNLRDEYLRKANAGRAI